MKLIELFGKSLLTLCAVVALAFTVGCGDKGDGGGGGAEEPAKTEEPAPEAEGGGEAEGEAGGEAKE